MKGFGTNKNGSVICAVDFGPATGAVIQTGCSLGKALGQNVEALHVVVPVPTDLAGLDHPLYAPYPPVNQAIQEEILAEKRSAMEELVRASEGKVQGGSVHLGAVVDEILAFRASKNADVIITGISPRDFHRTLGGLSTALALMHAADCPVIAVDQDCSHDFTTPGARILVLDDLRDDTLGAVNWAYNLATILPNARVRHTHVIPPAEGALTRGLKRAWGSLGYGPSEPISDEDFELYSLDKLRKRSPRDFQANVEFDLRRGIVADEIGKAARDHAADLLVFGRHRLLHTRPFLIGRMPVSAMLSAHRPIAVVPAA